MNQALAGIRIIDIMESITQAVTTILIESATYRCAHFPT
jgi:hypothetical protein